MARRSVSEQTKELFSQHGKTMGQRLKKDEAVAMLEKDYRLTQPEACVIFDFFDQDHNDEFSMWEFQHFYDRMGHRARPTMDLFKELEDKERPGTLDMGRAFDRLKDFKKEDGAALTEKELANMLQGFAGPEKSIDLPKFINLICGLRLALDPETPDKHSAS